MVGINMLINNWFDFIFHSFFIFVLGIGLCIVASIFTLASVFKASKSMGFSWGGLFDKLPPHVQNPIQKVVTSIFGIALSVYALFVLGWFYKYVDAAKAFLEK